MKKIAIVLIAIIGFAIVSVTSSFCCNTCGQSETLNGHEWVDLGLPSGTLWKQYNESTAYTYDYAIRYYDGFLPTSGKFQELVENCTWEWTGNGYKIIGNNGNYIYLKANFTRGDDICGAYWSSTKYDSGCCYGLLFYSSIYKVDRTCNLDYKRNVILCK